MTTARRCVLITGGASGLGLAYARAFAGEGCALFLADAGTDIAGHRPDPTRVEHVAAALREGGTLVATDAGDAGSPGVPARWVERATAELGGLDVVIASAGHHVESSLLQTDEDTVERAMRVYVQSAFALTRAAAQTFIARRHGGSIFLTITPNALFGAQRQSVVSAASAAVTALVRSSALELRRHDIRVLALAPLARTRQTEGLPLFESIAPTSMTTDHVARVVRALAHPSAPDLSGEVIGVAGGRIYGIRARETAGIFETEREVDLPTLVSRLPSALR